MSFPPRGGMDTDRAAWDAFVGELETPPAAELGEILATAEWAWPDLRFDRVAFARALGQKMRASADALGDLWALHVLATTRVSLGDPRVVHGYSPRSLPSTK